MKEIRECLYEKDQRMSMKEIKNVNKVQKQFWDSWNVKAQVAFNHSYRKFLVQDIYSHPKAQIRSREHWKTTAWNCAFEVAEEVNRVINLAVSLHGDCASKLLN
jgi:hypothetical protein